MRLLQLRQYNRDWIKYLLRRYIPDPHDQPLQFRLRNGQTVSINSDARFTLNEIYLDRLYDVPGVDFARCVSVLDLGANAGVFALYAASKSPRASVYCFEPSAQNFTILTRNLKDNHVRAIPYQMA